MMNALYRQDHWNTSPVLSIVKTVEEFRMTSQGWRILGETYGITVYQEQVMLLSQKLAGFSKGMPMFCGKPWKRFLLTAKAKPQFIDGEKPTVIPKMCWKNLKTGGICRLCFQQVALHPLCVVGYQTAYLKAITRRVYGRGTVEQHERH